MALDLYVYWPIGPPNPTADALARTRRSVAADCTTCRPFILEEEEEEEEEGKVNNGEGSRPLPRTLEQ